MKNTDSLQPKVRCLNWFILLVLIAPVVSGEADGPDSWKVVRIGPQSGLNLRAQPSTSADVLSVIPYNAVALKNIECAPEYSITQWAQFSEEQAEQAALSRWCKVEYKGIVGWVYAFYIAEY